MVGDFYALKDPLTLLRVTFVDDDDRIEAVDAWVPRIEEPSKWFSMQGDERRLTYLWCQKGFPLTEYLAERGVREGDVWISSRQERLFFIASVERSSGKVLVVSDWNVTSEDWFDGALFQRGPLNPMNSPFSRFDLVK